MVRYNSKTDFCMKTKLIKTLFFLLTLNSFSQEITFVKDEILNKYKETGFLKKSFIPVGKIDEKHNKQGFWKNYITIKDFICVSNNGKPKKVNGFFLIYGEGSYINSKRTGKWTYYTIEDKTYKKILQKEVNYIDGFSDGAFKYFFTSGNIALKGNNNRSINERTIELYYLSGEIFATQHYKNKLKTGTQKFFYRNGVIHQKHNYNKGKKNGVQYYYHKNGQLWTEQIFNNDLLLNIKANYTQNGKLRDKGTIKDGNGTVKLYNEEGKVRTIITYKNGLKINEKKL